MVYTFAPGARVKADANEAGVLFERLEAQGRLTAANVVDESRPEDAPLHNEFEWNDGIAAEKYREEQARYLIRNIRIVNEKEEPRRMYFNIVQAEKGYSSINTILQSPDKTQALLEKALKDLISWQNRYKEIKELSGVVQEIERARRQYAMPEFAEARA